MEIEIINRINDKIREVENFLLELNKIKPETLEEYKLNVEKKSACERFCEKIIEGSVDLTYLIVKSEIKKDKKFKIPEDDVQAFDILQKKNIITQTLSKKLQDAKGMRNFLAHQYGKVNDEIVFTAISEDLEDDISELLKSISVYLNKTGKENGS